MSSIPARNRAVGAAGWQPRRREVLAAPFAAMMSLAAGGSACRAPGPAVAEPDIAALASRYVDLTMRLARHQPSLVEAWLGPAAAAGARTPAPPLRADVAALLADIEGAARRLPRAEGALADAAAIGPGDRISYLRGQVRALDEAAARLLGESRPFAEEARRTFGHEAPPRDTAALEAIRRELAARLPGPGALADRHRAFRRRHAVPADRVDAVFGAAVDWCRTAARTHLPLPDGETLITRAEDTEGWAAFSRPTGPLRSELWVARRGGADAAHLLQLAAHEGTPGHHAQHVLAAAELVRMRGWTERLLHPSFGPHRLFAEGAAEAGAEMLLPIAVRVQVCRDVLLPAAGQPAAVAETLVRVERLAAALDLEVAAIAAEYLDTPLGTEAATARLRDQALVLDPPGMLAFIEKQRTKMLAYPVGRRLVLEAVERGGSDRRWARLARISTTLGLDGGPGE